jgi:hypothetical protein
MEAHLAWSPQVVRDGADELAVKIEVTEAAVFAVAYKQQGLIVPNVDGKPMAAIEESVVVAFAAVAGLEPTLPVEPEYPAVAVSVGDEDGSIRSWNG